MAPEEKYTDEPEYDTAEDMLDWWDGYDRPQNDTFLPMAACVIMRQNQEIIERLDKLLAEKVGK